MKSPRWIKLFTACLVITGVGWAAEPKDNSILIRDVTIHPVTKPEVEHGSVLVIDGKITQVGRSVSTPNGVRVVDGHGLQLYPGMINAATNIGLAEIEALRDTVDLDEIGEFNPQLKAEIAFNPSSEYIPVTRAAGITTVLSLPSEGGSEARSFGQDASVITGQAALMHLTGWTWEEMALTPSAAVDMLFPRVEKIPRRYAAILAVRSKGYPELKKEQQKRIDEISQFFEEARRYKQAKAAHRPDFRLDDKLEAMIPVIDRQRPILVRAAKEREIKGAIEFAKREKVKIILADPREIGDTGPMLKAANIPVVLGKTLALPEDNDDAYDASYTLPNQFYRAGVKICFGTFDTQFARNVPFEAAAAVAFGLPKEEALKAVTINSAEILGVADRIGSIEEGKSADFILTDGDPLEAKTNIKQMFIDGKEVSLESRHTREYEKWLKRE